MKIKHIIKSVVFAALVLLPQIANSQDSNQDISSSNFSFDVGGFINPNVGVRSQERSFNQERLPDAVNANTGTINPMSDNPDFTGEAELHLKAFSVTESEMEYGAIVELEATSSSTTRSESFTADKAYIFAESEFGKFEVGNNSAANNKMKVGPQNFARGAGGINGRYLEYVNMPMLSNSANAGVGSSVCSGGVGVGTDGITPSTACGNVKLPRFILIPTSPISHGGYAKGFYNRDVDNNYSTNSADKEFGFNKSRTSSQIRDGQFGDLQDVTKLSYYSPRIEGFQAGLSFTPSTANSVTSAPISQDGSGDIKQAVSYGVNYSKNLGNIGFAVSATGETGKVEQNSAASSARNDLQAYDLGAIMTFFGITIGASYGDWGDSLQPKSGIYSCNYDPSQPLASQTCASGGRKFSNSTYHTAGIAYEFGPFASSLTYLKSNFQDNKYNAISFGVDYRMAKGLMPYVEITKYQFKSNQPQASDILDQSSVANSDRQLKDNEGYVALIGLLFSF